ncbi:MAG: Mrp/NBP35 family ATP-binding protein [Rhabdochlamydiaceae bacterium]|nr:Mrp/NBP35 family ATP-binding protein [Rhabdochlamydiaceae bacterium]
MLKDVRYIVAVAAGKGGVGKSSMAVNLALTWQKLGYQVGIFDADVYGPSLGIMMPLEKPVQIQKEHIEPGIFQGVQAMSLAYIKPNKEAVMARAPVANGLIAQCIEQVAWRDLDYLIVDFPPGTGDIQLTLMQMLPFSGAVLVTTPQEVASLDVQKAAQMFRHMGVSLLGVIENMSYFQDPNTSVRHFVFGEGGGVKISEQFGVPFLGQVPIDPEISRCADRGIALPFACPESLASRSFEEMAVKLGQILFTLEEAEKVCLKQFEYVWKEMD